jgi:16S rRNA (adenine1518-N6/adenine1519-N6)-dimethyltransferase
MRLRTRLGQHFLMHPAIAARIVHAAKLPKTATVLEIGPGKGILTRELLRKVKKVIAVELDPIYITKLRGEFAEEIEKNQLVLVHDDVRDLDFKKLPRGYAVVANIPYYITGEIIRIFLESARQPSSVTLLVQKEVAARIVGNPERSRGTRAKKESILSLSVKAYAAPRYEFTVPRGAFLPPPKVDSAVLSIADISRKHFKNRKAEKRFFDLLHAGFAHKRKFVRSNLRKLASENTFQNVGILKDARAEDLPLSAWLKLAKIPRSA